MERAETSTGHIDSATAADAPMNGAPEGDVLDDMSGKADLLADMPEADAPGEPGRNGHGTANVGQKDVMVPPFAPTRQGHAADQLLTSGPPGTDDWSFRVNLKPEEPKLFTMMAAEDQKIRSHTVNWQGLIRTYTIMETAVGGVPRIQYRDTVVGHQEARRPSLLGGLVDRAQNVMGRGKGMSNGTGQ